MVLRTDGSAHSEQPRRRCVPAHSGRVRFCESPKDVDARVGLAAEFGDEEGEKPLSLRASRVLAEEVSDLSDRRRAVTIGGPQFSCTTHPLASLRTPRSWRAGVFARGHAFGGAHGSRHTGSLEDPLDHRRHAESAGAVIGS